MTTLRSLLFGRPVTASPKPLPDILYQLDGREIRIGLRRNALAKRMVLRMARDGGSFILTLPKRHSLLAAKAFVTTSEGWMRQTMARQPPPIAVINGAELTLRGETLVVVTTGKLRGLVRHESRSPP